MREWKIAHLKDKRGWISLMCPDCGLTAFVHRVSWLRASDYGTRPCTGCFQTFWIPGKKPDTLQAKSRKRSP
jgi:hypothetical protein